MPSVGNILRLEAEDATLRFFVSNILRASETDASYQWTPRPHHLYRRGGTVGHVQVDDFSAGNFKLDACDMCRHMAARLESNSFEWNVLRMFAVHGLDWGRMVYGHTWFGSLV
jgi:hypothetical protein